MLNTQIKKDFGLRTLLLTILLALSLCTAVRAAEDYTSGDTVRRVQAALQAAGYECGAADGQIGPNTLQALRRFQQDKGLTVDGEIGQEVLKALGLDGSGTETAPGESSEKPAPAETVQSAGPTWEDYAEPGDTWNVLLIGSDRRGDGYNGNSDTMILLTINRKSQRISMVSFMRDLYAEIPGYSPQKLNAAYSIGGPALLEETLTSMFGVKIDHYVAADFKAVVEMIDLMGGVEVTQTAEEAEVTNGYIHSLCEDWGMSTDGYYITEGTSHLNGLQALAYMRDRFVGNDYARTARQREVLGKLAAGLDFSDLPGLTLLVTRALTLVDHDLDITDLISLAADASAIRSYEPVTDRIPYDDLYYSENEMLHASMPETRTRLLQTVYGE